MTPTEASAQLDLIAESLKSRGALSILRATGGDPDVAVKRGEELYEMGCRALEVTMDSTDWEYTIRQLRARLPSDCILGVGTVMDDTVCDVALAANAGCTFALSPVDPV